MASLSHPLPRRDRRAGEWLMRLRARMLPTALDHDLATGADPRRSPAHSVRAARLVSRKFRRAIALGLERTVEAATEPPTTFSAAAPLRRADVLDATAELRILATLVREVEHASPAGVARARLLLVEGTGPLYSDTGDPDAIRRAALAAADALCRRLDEILTPRRSFCTRP